MLVSMPSCVTHRVTEREQISENIAREQIRHDTLRLTQLRYDSIYVERDHSIDRTRDTIRVVDLQKEYRYQLLHDTTYIVRLDTVLCDVEKIQVQEVIKTKTIARPRTWLDYLSYASLLLLLVWLSLRLRSLLT